VTGGSSRSNTMRSSFATLAPLARTRSGDSFTNAAAPSRSSGTSATCAVKPGRPPSFRTSVYGP